MSGAAISLKDLALRIDAHLQRWEADPLINGYFRDLKSFYCAAACVNGRYLCVRYISYQGGSNLTREQAQHYLHCIETKGFVGRHFEALRRYPIPKDAKPTETWYAVWGSRIDTVQVERANDTSVWIDGRREARITSRKRYYPTWEKAHESMAVAAQRGVESAREHLASAEKWLAEVKAMKKERS